MEIILGTVDWSRHEAHREEWITTTGRDNNELEGVGEGIGDVGGVSSPDRSGSRKAT